MSSFDVFMIIMCVCQSPFANNGTEYCTTHIYNDIVYYTGLILGLRPANERRRYLVMTSLIGRAQA